MRDYRYYLLHQTAHLGRLEGPLTPAQSIRAERIFESLKLRADHQDVDRLWTYARRSTWR